MTTITLAHAPKPNKTSVCNHSVDVCTIAAVGHGKSEGDRAHISNFRAYYDDVIQHVEDTKADYPDIPCFLMGHSNVSMTSI